MQELDLKKAQSKLTQRQRARIESFDPRLRSALGELPKSEISKFFMLKGVLFWTEMFLVLGVVVLGGLALGALEVFFESHEWLHLALSFSGMAATAVLGVCTNLASKAFTKLLRRRVRVKHIAWKKSQRLLSTPAAPSGAPTSF